MQRGCMCSGKFTREKFICERPTPAMQSSPSSASEKSCSSFDAPRLLVDCEAASFPTTRYGNPGVMFMEYSIQYVPGNVHAWFAWQGAIVERAAIVVADFYNPTMQ